MAKPMLSDVISTPVFTASFPHLLAPSLNPNNNKIEYGVTMLFDKKTADLTVIRAAIKKLSDVFFAAMPNKTALYMPISDGDAPNTNGVVLDSHKGHWVVKAKSTYRPTAFGSNGLEIVQDGEIYAGCKMKAKIQLMAYDKVSKGITCRLLSVFKVADGEPLSGGARVTADAWASEVAGQDSGM